MKNREQIIEALNGLGLSGETLVKKIESQICELTNRLAADGTYPLEYKSAVAIESDDVGWLEMYYEVDRDWVDSLDDDVDYEDLTDWDSCITGYRLI